jgi:hypothetical protein
LRNDHRWRCLIAGAGYSGAWEGTLYLPGNGVHRWESPKTLLVLRIACVHGAYQANLDNIGAGDQHQLETFTYKYPFAHGEITPTNDDFPSFDGQVNRFGDKLTGNFRGKNQAFPPVVFRRTTHPTPFPEPLIKAEFAPRPDSALQGLWVGMVGQGKGAVNIQFKIAEASDGTFRAEFYAPDQVGTKRFPAAVSYDGTTVKLTLMVGLGMFEGWLHDGGKEIVGNWINNDYRTTTTVTKENHSDHED